MKAEASRLIPGTLARNRCLSIVVSQLFANVWKCTKQN